jgi:hypothetical protein
VLLRIFWHFAISCTFSLCFIAWTAVPDFSTFSRMPEMVFKSLFTTSFRPSFVHELKIRTY